ncbi:MAG TPA: hypothetical protein VE959_32370 [Bryobacteraceae bacterium]|nr:hypothetical protein [Bryobacteraceae bacterium]
MADPPIVPLGVCEVLRDLPAEDGKSIAVLGRYSFRENGRWIGEQVCDPPVEIAPQLWLVESSSGPMPPQDYQIDGQALRKKLAEIQRHTSLGKFRFGTPDYDRWAVVFGQIKPRQGEDAKKAPANLVFRGDGVVIFLAPQ